MMTAIVTGGSRGIGLATVIELSRNGYQIILVATKPEEYYPDSVKILKREKVHYLWISADISKHEDRLRIVNSAVEKFERIDVLVNNAGVAPKQRNDLLEMTEQSFDFVVGTNTKGNMFLTQAVANKMIHQDIIDGRRGIIVNISSCSAVVSSTNRGEYCVSKAGISMLTTLYADRLAPENIFVYEVRPGIIKTDMTNKVQDKYDNLIKNGAFPIARWGTPEDVAKAVRIFCSGDLLYTTGNYIDIDGGYHIQRL